MYVQGLQDDEEQNQQQAPTATNLISGSPSGTTSPDQTSAVGSGGTSVASSTTPSTSNGPVQLSSGAAQDSNAGGSGGSAKSAAPATAGTSTGSGPQAGTGMTGWTNLSTFLNAQNPDAINLLGSNVAGQINNLTNAANQAINNYGTTTSQAIQNGIGNNFIPDQNTVNAAANGDTTAQQIIAGYTTGSNYTGPTADQVGNGAGAATNAVTAAQNAGTAATDQGGLGQFTQQAASRPDQYTQGDATLDSALLGATPSAMSMIKGAAANTQNLGNQLTSRENSLQQQATNASNPSATAVGTIQQEAGADTSNINKAANSTLASDQSQAANWNQAINDITTGNTAALEANPTLMSLLGINANDLNNLTSQFNQASQYTNPTLATKQAFKGVGDEPASTYWTAPDGHQYFLTGGGIWDMTTNANILTPTPTTATNLPTGTTLQSLLAGALSNSNQVAGPTSTNQVLTQAQANELNYLAGLQGLPQNYTAGTWSLNAPTYNFANINNQVQQVLTAQQTYSTQVADYNAAVTEWNKVYGADGGTPPPQGYHHA